MKRLLLACAILAVLNLRAVADEPADTTLDFTNAPVTDVLQFYGTLVGQQVIADPTVQGQITLKTNQRVSKAEAQNLIETTLFMYGFALIDSPDGKMVKVLGLGKPVRVEALPVCTTLDELPKHERIVSYLVHLKAGEPNAVVGFLQQYALSSTTVGFTASRPDVMIMTVPTSRVRPLLKLVEAVDVPAKEGVGQGNASSVPLPMSPQPAVITPVPPPAPRPTQAVPSLRTVPRPSLPPVGPAKNDGDDDDDN